MTDITVQRDHTQLFLVRMMFLTQINPPTQASIIQADSCLNDNKSLCKQRLLSADDPVKPDELSHA